MQKEFKELIDLIEYSSTNETESPRVEKGQQKQEKEKKAENENELSSVTLCLFHQTQKYAVDIC